MLFKIYRRGASNLLRFLVENGVSQKQKQFVANSITVCDKEREWKRGNASQNRNRQSTMTYHLGDVAVCKTMFFQTLYVGEVCQKCSEKM